MPGGLDNSGMPAVEELAKTFRDHLQLTGIGRRELYISERTRENITFYGLRATGITWMAIHGDDPLRIKHRAGHKSFTTTEGYTREAETVTEGFGQVFPPLPAPLYSAPGESSGNRPGAGSGASLDQAQSLIIPHWWAMKDLNLQPMD